MKKLISILALGLWVFGCLNLSAQEKQIREATVAEVTAGTKGMPAVITPRRLGAFTGSGGGGGGIVSNVYNPGIVLATLYTNSTPYHAFMVLGVQGLGMVTAMMIVDTNRDGTTDFRYFQTATNAVAQTNTLMGLVPSGASFNVSITGGTSGKSGYDAIYYFSTNSGSGGADIASQSGNGTNTALFAARKLATTNSTYADPYRGTDISNGVYKVSAYNTTTAGGHTAAVGAFPGFSFRRQDNDAEIGFIGMWDDHASAAFTPEMIIQSDGNIALVDGFAGENANIQLGKNQYNSGFINLGHAGFGINDGLTFLTQPGWAHGQRLIFPATTAGAVYSYPGIMSLNGGSNAVYAGYGLGELLFFTASPIWAVGSGFTNSPGIPVLRMKTNALEVIGGGGFIGNGLYITNRPFAVFHESYNSGGATRTIPATTFTNINFTTNAAINFDTAGAFTLSNSFLIVNAAGAGVWKVRSKVEFYNNVDAGGSGAVCSRLYKYAPGATGLLIGTGAYQFNFAAVDSQISGKVTLAAGDVIGLQAWATATANTGIGRTLTWGDAFSCAYLEFDKQ